jgi:hypothetical protein
MNPVIKLVPYSTAENRRNRLSTVKEALKDQRKTNLVAQHRGIQRLTQKTDVLCLLPL